MATGVRTSIAVRRIGYSGRLLAAVCCARLRRDSLLVGCREMGRSSGGRGLDGSGGGAETAMSAQNLRMGSDRLHAELPGAVRLKNVPST